jgi:hypothetical protein
MNKRLPRDVFFGAARRCGTAARLFSSRDWGFDLFKDATSAMTATFYRRHSPEL